MFAKILAILALAFTLQSGECYTRVEITSQFQPTLLRLRDLANVKYLEVDKQYKTLLTQLDKNQVRTKNSTQTQINNIKQLIADAKKTPNVTTKVLTCIRNQETIALRLTTTVLNPCYPTTNISALNTCRTKYTTIASVAGNTVTYCQYLNPLGSQLESFGRCLADKVPDLNRQINIIGTEYDELSNSTLQSNIRCLTENVGKIMGQISVISYEVNLCFFDSV